MKIHSIYDNGGETFDRYTVYYGTLERDGRRACLGMSERPNHPQGFGQHGSGTPGRHNGKRIRFEDLPAACQQVVLEDLK